MGINKPLIIIGGSGHGSVIEACIKDNRKHGDYEWDLKGFCNDFDTDVDGYPVIGKLSDIPRLIREGYWFIYGIHLIADNYKTAEIYDRIKIPKERLATVIHHTAFIDDTVVIEPGCLVMYNAYIAPRTHIGESTMIKANTNIGHDVMIGRLCHIAMGATIVSCVNIGECADIAVSATILAHKKIGNYGMLSAVALATHDIPEGEIWAGIPAKFLKKMKINNETMLTIRETGGGIFAHSANAYNIGGLFNYRRTAA